VTLVPPHHRQGEQPLQGPHNKRGCVPRSEEHLSLRQHELTARLHESADRAGGAPQSRRPLEVGRIAASLSSASSQKASTCTTS
jgi:hypothetical protein